ncbi:NUDIX hydrolase [Formosa sp. S-31]|uniref:NUDIX hydrolase n=1 Tax=Formosa sp. S-31 TaxID=2790949 RepID=UPI003EBFD48A
MKTWKIISETDVSPSPWFPIQKHTIELPNGTLIDDYYITTLGNVAMVLPITTDNEIVMVKQYKHGIKEVVIELPAGFQQNGKSIEDSALAELEEETGIKTSLDKLIPIGKIANVPTKSSQISFGFLATGVTFNSTQNLDINEDIEIIKRTPTETLKMIQNGEIWVADTVAFIMKAYLMFPELFK